jgi:hypothetical protein
MKKNFIIFSSYTIGTSYEKIIKNLESDCNKLKIPFISTSYNSTGSWVKNTMLKPTLILRDWSFLSKVYESLVWVDADARIKSYPDVFDKFIQEDIDFSVFQMGSISRVTSGTIFMRLTDKVKKFVMLWQRLCDIQKTPIGDQKELRELISKGFYSTLNIKYKALPYSYCYIFDDTLKRLEPKIPSLVGEPVILHMQESRNQKK